MEKSLDENSAIRTVQVLTILWTSIELSVGLSRGIATHSLALTVFGADSAIELVSAVVILLRFNIGPQMEARAARICGLLLYALAAYIAVLAVLAFAGKAPQAEPSLVGVGLLLAAGLVMPLLGRAKKRLARETASQALRADATQSSICAFMSWISLAGLLTNQIFHLPWADSLAALLLLPIVLKEANETVHGRSCDCC